MIRRLTMFALLALVVALSGCAWAPGPFTGCWDGCNNSANRSNSGQSVSYRGWADESVSTH
jgi:hypothetical protein